MAVLDASARGDAIGGGRALWVDVARGGAIVAMVIYHFSFDLMYFGLVDWPVAGGAGWRAFAAAIASTFLFLVGVSLVYAHEGGIRWRPFARRLAILVAAAAVVTVGTVYAIPAPIYFGILHAIAAFSVLALAFLRAPVWLTLMAAALVFAAPLVATSPVFDAPWFYPLGLAAERPYTFDYEPVFPWFAVTLLGVATAKLLPRGQWQPAPAALRWLTFAGRHSLIIYLLHQPVLFALFMGWAALGSPGPAG